MYSMMTMTSVSVSEINQMGTKKKKTHPPGQQQGRTVTPELGPRARQLIGALNLLSFLPCFFSFLPPSLFPSLSPYLPSFLQCMMYTHIHICACSYVYAYVCVCAHGGQRPHSFPLSLSLFCFKTGSLRVPRALRWSAGKTALQKSSSLHIPTPPQDEGCRCVLPYLASFIFLILFYVHGCFKSMHMCCAVCTLGAHKGPKMVLDSWDLQWEVVMCAGNAGPLQEQQVRWTTDPSVPVLVCLLGFWFFSFSRRSWGWKVLRPTQQTFSTLYHLPSPWVSISSSKKREQRYLQGRGHKDSENGWMTKCWLYYLILNIP